MVNHILLNSVFLKNLSPLITADVIRDFLIPNLSSPDEILRIDFRHFPGSVQKFCQVDFRTSAGVTAATSLNGHSLLGVPVVATVIDPLYQATTSLPTSAYLPSTISTSNSSVPINLTPSTFLPASCPNIFLNETQQLNRTVHVANIPEKWELDRLIVLLSAHVKQLQRTTLIVTDKKLIEGIVPETGKPDRIALIEFKTSEMAEYTRKLPAFARFIDGKELVISQAKTTVSPREPDNVSFDLPPSVPVPVAYQQLNKLKLQEKIARARSLAQGIIATAVSKHTKSSVSSRPHKQESEADASRIVDRQKQLNRDERSEENQHSSSKLRHRESRSPKRSKRSESLLRHPVNRRHDYPRSPRFLVIKDRKNRGVTVARKRYSSSKERRRGHRKHHRSSPIRGQSSLSKRSSVKDKKRYSHERHSHRHRSSELQRSRKRSEHTRSKNVSSEITYGRSDERHSDKLSGFGVILKKSPREATVENNLVEQEKASKHKSSRLKSRKKLESSSPTKNTEKTASTSPKQTKTENKDAITDSHKDFIKSFRTVTSEHEMSDRIRELKEELRRRLKRSKE